MQHVKVCSEGHLIFTLVNIINNTADVLKLLCMQYSDIKVVHE